MSIIEALTALKDGTANAVHRACWDDDPTTVGTVVIFSPNNYGDLHYWYSLANPPEHPWEFEDDARVGSPIGMFSIGDILAKDWEVKNI